MDDFFEQDFSELFPEYIGFGVRDLDLLRIVCSGERKRETVRAGYRSKEGDLVYAIEMDGESCQVEEYFDGSVIGMTKAKTLEEAFSQKFMTFDPLSHPRFKQMIERITANRNIYFQPFDETRVVSFPAGLHFILRLPIVGDEREEIINMEIKNKVFSFDIDFEGITDGNIIRFLTRKIPGGSYYENGESKVKEDTQITAESRHIADFSTTLLDLEEAVQLCCDLDLVLDPEPPYKVYGLVIMEVAQSVPGALFSHPGNNVGCYAYSVLLNRPGDILLQQAIEMYEHTFLK